MEYVKLNNGVVMPILGYGVFQIPDLAECERCVTDALEIGYRSIDTAQAYGNERAVGNAVVKSGLPRSELFITTKIFVDHYGYDKAMASIERSLRKLQTNYIDLMLVHQPFSDYYGAYHALERAYKDGVLRAIGVSNFYPDRLADIATFAEVTPAVNQVETHVFNQQKTANVWMKKYGVQIESWGPFAEGKNDFFTNETMVKIGKKYDKTAAQVGLRFLIQHDVVVIPKSTHKERMIENFDVFDFALSGEDMGEIDKLDTGASLFFHHQTPEVVERFVNIIRERRKNPEISGE